jgi:hypothetical protein
MIKLFLGRPFLILFAVVAIAGCWWVVDASESFQACTQQQKHGETGKYYETAKKRHGAVFVVVVTRYVYGTCAGRFANENNGALTAIFTVALVVVGGLQVRVYRHQAGLMGQQSEISDRQATIMDRQAKTADSQTKIMADQLATTRAIERAFLAVEPLSGSSTSPASGPS